MPSGLLSNLNVAFNLGNFHRAVSIKLSRPLHLISRKNSVVSVSGSTSELLRYSSNKCLTRTMAASGSIAASGDLVVDKLVSNPGSFSGFVKPSCVFFNDRSYRNCRLGRVSLRNGEACSCLGAQGCFVFNSERKSCYTSPLFLNGSPDCRSFSSSCSSDGTMPEVSTDESFNAGHLSSLALSAEKPRSHSVLKLQSGVCYMPHPAKEETGGEDAHFICSDQQVIGVADGVGGWADVGVNAGLYARELMSNSVKAIQEVPSSDVDLMRVLEKAHAATKAMGSSTACIVALKNQSLHALNLGDSGFIVVRDGCTIFESPIQQHGFNFTYQLENSDRSDQPSSGQVFEIPVIPGDIVVAGSDGLFDNLYSKEVAAIVGDAVKEGLSPDAMAQKIAAIARVRALDRKFQTPFATAAQEAGYTFYGGKLDDLTVVVSFVSKPADA